MFIHVAHVSTSFLVYEWEFIVVTFKVAAGPHSFWVSHLVCKIRTPLSCMGRKTWLPTQGSVCSTGHFSFAEMTCHQRGCLSTARSTEHRALHQMVVPQLLPLGRGFRVELCPGKLLTHCHSRLHSLILISQPTVVWLSAVNSLHGIFEYSAYCLNTLSPDENMKSPALTQHV